LPLLGVASIARLRSMSRDRVSEKRSGRANQQGALDATSVDVGRLGTTGKLPEFG